VLALLALCFISNHAFAQDMDKIAKCEICSVVFQDMELLTSCDYAVHDWSHGTIHLLELNNPALMQKFRDFEKHDKETSAKFMKLGDAECTERLCGGCAEYFKFRRKGLGEERIQTPNGTIVLTRTADPALLEEVHDWSARMREMMAAFDPSAFGASPAEAKACCGSCSSTASCTAKSESSAEATCTIGSAAADGRTAVAGTCDSSAAKREKDPLSMFPPNVVEEMKKCALCSLMMAQPELMFAAKPEVTTLPSGMVITDTVIDKNNLARYQAFQTKFHDRIEELEKESGWDDAKSKVCSFCWKFAELDKAGAHLDWGLTSDGTVTVVTAKDAALVKKIHALAEEMKACCAMFEGYF